MLALGSASFDLVQLRNCNFPFLIFMFIVSGNAGNMLALEQRNIRSEYGRLRELERGRTARFGREYAHVCMLAP
jgi:hypothetical protein